MGAKSIFYYISEAFRSIMRNGWMSIASVGVVAITLFILGSFMLLNINIEHMTEEIKSQVEIIAYVDETVEEEALDDIRVSLIKIEELEEVRFVSRDEALQRLRESLGDVVAGYEEEGRNPLRDSFEIRTKEPEDVAVVAASLEEIEGIARVDYGTEVVERLFSFTAVVKLVGFAFMAALALTACFLIANTIKLTVNARSAEIKIMKYVGATEWFIRWPFLIEGLLLGFFGAVIPLLVLLYAYSRAIAWVQANLYFLPLVELTRAFSVTVLVLLLLGTVIGGFGSIISMRRFLKV